MTIWLALLIQHMPVGTIGSAQIPMDYFHAVYQTKALCEREAEVAAQNLERGYRQFKITFKCVELRVM